MKPQFTPPPWIVRFDEDRFDSKLSVIEVIDGSEASLNHPQGELVLARVNVSAFAPHMDEPMANARLIASAPELLAALEAMTKAYVELVQSDYPSSWSPENDKEVISARAIIAKAKGMA